MKMNFNKLILGTQLGGMICLFVIIIISYAFYKIDIYAFGLISALALLWLFVIINYYDVNETHDKFVKDMGWDTVDHKRK